MWMWYVVWSLLGVFAYFVIAGLTSTLLYRLSDNYDRDDACAAGMLWPIMLPYKGVQMLTDGGMDKLNRWSRAREKEREEERERLATLRLEIDREFNKLVKEQVSLLMGRKVGDEWEESTQKTRTS